jgi:hypothetical protein
MDVDGPSQKSVLPAGGGVARMSRVPWSWAGVKKAGRINRIVKK